MNACTFIMAASSVKPMELLIVKRILVACVALAAVPLAATPASAEITEEFARATVAPFYDALNAAPGKDAAALLMGATSPEWVSCGTNDTCGAHPSHCGHRRAPQSHSRSQMGDQGESGVGMVRGETNGTPAGDFMGVPLGGKSFKLMSIDVHTIEGGKITRAYHVEDWMGAIRQLSAK